MGWATGFSAGSQFGRGLVDTYRQSQDYRDKELRKKEMADIAGAQGTEAYTAEQAAQLEAASKATDPDGKPYYTVGNDAAGKYTLTPNFQNETGAAPTDYAPSTMAAKGVNFLGKNYDAPLTETQTTSARQQAMAGVMERSGDVEGAMRYREQAKQGLRNDRLDARQAVMDTRQDEQFAQDDLYKKSKLAVDAQNPQALLDTEFAQAQEKHQAGLAPTAPVKGTVTPGQQMEYYAKVIANENQFGKLGVKDMMAFDQMRTKLNDEGYVKTLKSAHNGATLLELTKVFGQQGQAKFDPELVASDRMGKNAAGMPTRIITFKDGRVLDTLKELESLDAADKLTTRFYQAKTDGRADQSLGIQQAQLGLSQQNAADGRSDKSALRTAGAAYELARQNGNEAGMKAATLDLIKAGGTAPGGANANDPAEVKLANAYIRAGLAGNLAEGLQLATSSKDSSPDKVRTDVYVKALAANFGNAEAAKKATNDAMTYLFPAGSKPSRSASGKVSQPSFKDQGEVDAAVKSGKLKPGDRITINGVSGTWR